MTAHSVTPSATYRVQVQPGFTFADTAAAVPYLAALGVTHVHLSPVLEAVPGSTHGYDVVDHTRVRAELGGEQGLRELSRTAREHGLGLILDIVPNHMAVPAPEHLNGPLWAVLRDGPSSPYADWFDIDWSSLGGKVLLPVLGEPVPDVLGDLSVVRDKAAGGRVLRYHDHRFPLRPGTEGLPLPELLDAQWYRLAYWRAARTDVNYRRFFTISDLIAVRVEHPEVFEATHATVLRLLRDGVADGLRIDHPDGLADPAGYLRRLAEASGGRWTVVEKILHRDESLPEEWTCAGTTGYDALDRIDGLFTDPAGVAELAAFYRDFTGVPDDRGGRWAPTARRAAYRIVTHDLAAEVGRLRRTAERAALPGRPLCSPETLATAIRELLVRVPVYRPYVRPGTPPTAHDAAMLERATAEARCESSPELAPALDFVRDLALGRAGGEPEASEAADPGARPAAAQGPGAGPASGRVAGEPETHGAAETDGGGTATVPDTGRGDDRPNAGRVPRSDAHARPADTPGPGAASAPARDSGGRAATAGTDAGARSPAGKAAGQNAAPQDAAHPDADDFAVRFAQVASALHAKAVEDTAFYRYVPLLSLCEVGRDPGRPATTPEEFHAYCARVVRERPGTGTVLSTHDTKRSADLRLRLAVLSEMPDAWRAWLGEHPARAEALGCPPAPDRHTEYSVFQTGVGLGFCHPDRLVPAALKAVREAGLRTTWTEPDQAYEQAVGDFAGEGPCGVQVYDIGEFAGRLRPYEEANSLGAALLHLTMPGVPDLYQGTEFPVRTLVDPDNRGPLTAPVPGTTRFGRDRTLRGLLDGAAPHGFDEVKLRLTAVTLRLRRDHPQWYGPAAAYEPLAAEGPAAGHCVAFLRGGGALTAVTRLSRRLAEGGGWRGTVLPLPPGRWRDRLGGGTYEGRVPLGELLDGSPVALLTREA
ncbi:malto-oligosyltrehalose synthase [Streptomyces sp.]|uniref:malto-oligosyltrehalose synthase n=1 Tax=Streptomyces sp. TaxID=1931 RepID=UPI002F42910F